MIIFILLLFYFHLTPNFFSPNSGENKYYPDSYTCVGHAAADPVLPSMLPFTGSLATDADTNGDSIISNWEFLAYMNPNDPNGLDYVFDHFEWTHCDGFVVK